MSVHDKLNDTNIVEEITGVNDLGGSESVCPELFRQFIDKFLHTLL
jgi:hypothetical protein